MITTMVPMTAEEGSEVRSGLAFLFPASYDIIWSAVVFVILLVLFWRLVLPRVTKLLDERSAAIEGGIKKAEIAQAEAQAALEEYRAQLAEGRAEASRIREQARTEGQQIIAEMKEQASAEAARITAQAHAQIEAERQAAVASLRAEVGTLAVDLASGILGESLADDRKVSATVDRFLADLETEGSKA